MDTYRSSFITERDFQMIRSFGFNVVRLPIDYRLLQSDEAPYAIKEDGFKWLDRAVSMAESSGIYIILDLHSAPGGQSLDQCTGQAGQNHLWNNPVNQKREVDIWRAIATRYRNRSAVAAYDIMNEPYADHHMDVRGELKTIMRDCYTAIRETGDQHVMFFPGALGAPPTFYGDPHDNGWTNVGFTEHFYPGLFGSKVAFESHIQTLVKTIPTRQKWLDRIQSPYYIGEFNPVLDATGGTRVTRAYYDTFAQHGWAGTLWSYKLVKPDGGASSNTWYCVSNASPLPRLDLDTSSYEDFSRFFTSLATVPLAPNQPLLKAVTGPNPEPLPVAGTPLPQGIPPATVATNTVAPPGWSTVDIGGNPTGAVSLEPQDTLTIIAGGLDVFAHHDAFRFVSKPGEPNLDFVARVNSLLESDPYAKAGVMARWGNDPAAAFAMINAFPDGNVAFISRAKSGEDAKEIKAGSGSFPIDLRLATRDGKIVATYRRAGMDWTQAGEIELPTSQPYQVGLAVDSHNEESLTKAAFQLTDANSPPPVVHEVTEISLLKNGSFEDAGTQPDLAENWTRVGGGFNRETQWSPTHSGTAELGYHHWEIDSKASSEMWQDVPVQAGKRYRFSVFALRDDPKGANDVAKIELRLDGQLDGHPVTLNSTTLKASEIGAGSKWTRAVVDGTALGDTMRVHIIVSPAAAAPRGGAVKLDDAVLQLVSGGK